MPPLTDAQSRARLGLTLEEARGIASMHTLAVQAWLPAQAPRAERFEGEGTVAVSNGMAARLFNQALGTHFTAATLGEIGRVKAFFSARGVPWMWWVGATPQPADIFDHFARYRIHKFRDLPALIARLPNAHLPADRANIRVWQAASVDDLTAASSIRRTAFNFPAGVALTYFEDSAASWLANPDAALYLASVDSGPPACIAALIAGAGYAGVYAMATLPEWRRRGLGKAVMRRIMLDAEAQGHEYLILTASDVGKLLYEACGFIHVMDMALCGPQG